MSKPRTRATRFPGVRRLRAGEYLVRVTWTDPATGRQRERKATIQARSAAEAARIRQELLDEALVGGEALPTVAEFATLWIQWKAPTLRPSTRKQYATVLDVHVLPTFGEVRIDQVTRAQMVAWRAAQQGRAATTNGRLRVFKTLMRDAAAEHAFVDPTQRISALPADVDDEDRSKVLSAAELREVLEAVQIHQPKWYPITLTLALTGARWGAVSALKWPDVDFGERTITFRRSHTRGELSAGDKTRKRKVVPMMPQLLETLRAHRQQQIRDQVVGLDAGWLFPSRVGGLMQPSSLRKPMRSACAAAGIERVPTAHWFRYSMSSLLRKANVGMVQRAITGHATQEMAEHYDHVTMDERRAALEAAWKLVKK